MAKEQKKAVLYAYVGTDLPTAEDGWKKTDIELGMNQKIQKLSWRCEEWGSNNIVVQKKDLDSLTGQVLTLCDAMIADVGQREAWKKLLRSTIHKWHDEKFYRYQLDK